VCDSLKPADILLVEDSPEVASSPIRALTKRRLVNNIVAVEDRGAEALDFPLCPRQVRDRANMERPRLVCSTSSCRGSMASKVLRPDQR